MEPYLLSVLNLKLDLGRSTLPPGALGSPPFLAPRRLAPRPPGDLPLLQTVWELNELVFYLVLIRGIASILYLA